MNCLAFLETFYPDGPWALTAISVDQRQIEGETFGPASRTKADEWIQARNGKSNLYFHVNVPRPHPPKSKYERGDILEVAYLHVDIDTRAGEDFSEEFKRIRTLLDEKCPVPAPTWIVFSGGGYQAFWKLRESIPIHGQIPAAEEVARYNKQLELLFGGDHCFNIDRIMRLPGSINLPNERKRKRGRVPVEAEVYRYSPENVYDISAFVPAPEVQVRGVESVPVRFGDVRRIELDELKKWNVPDRVGVIIVQGHHPDEIKDGDNSRSAWLFDACCQLVRAGVPDEVIFGIITDSDYKISASVLDKRPKEREYATRQIQRARDEAENPFLRKMNDRFIVIGNLGGTCRVVEDVEDAATKRRRFTKQTFSDFRNRFSNLSVPVSDKKTMPLGAWWLNHPQRRQFEYLVFAPGTIVPNAYNLWQGFGCLPVAGSKHESYLRHLEENICRKNHRWFEYLLNWMARTVQFPASIGETAIVLRGKSGTGKSFFAKVFGAVFGRHFIQVSDAKHLVGNFNGHLRDCLVLFGDEAFYAGDRRHESALKTLVTEETLIIENKGVDAETAPNYLHLVLASNSDWVVPAGATERRFFVLDVHDGHRLDTRYFQAIRADIENGGLENLLFYLMNRDLSNFEVRDVPPTPALREQKGHSMGPMEDWWSTKLDEGSLVQGSMEYQHVIPINVLHEDYINHCRRYNILYVGNRTKLGYFLKKVCPDGFPRRIRVSTGLRDYCYEFPQQLRHLRDKWIELYGEEEGGWSIPDTVSTNGSGSYEDSVL